jgi:hypothetical protein
VGLKRLIEVVRDGNGTLSVVLAGHPKLKNDLRRPTMRYGNDSPENGPDLNWLLGRERAGEQSHSPVVVVSGPY